jgi:hypothetical protein
MVQVDTDAPTDNVTRFPSATPETQAHPRDPTSALRSKRYRKSRKQGAKRDGRTSNRGGKTAPDGQIPRAEKPNEIKPSVTVHVAPPLVPNAHEGARHGAAVDVAAYGAAIALAGAAAWFSIRGMVVIFPGSPVPVVGMAVAMEGAKLITAGWLARRWRATAVAWRAALVAFVFGLALINAAGVYAQLVAAHVGERGAAQSDIEAKDAALAARLESQIHIVADLDRRLGQIDTTIEEAAKRGRTNAALSAMEGQRKARAALVDERNREAGTLLAALKAERASLSARGKQIETEAAPIRYVAEFLGVDTDSERAIRWLIALMVLCCDPLAIALTAAASARRSAAGAVPRAILAVARPNGFERAAKEIVRDPEADGSGSANRTLRSVPRWRPATRTRAANAPLP